MWRSAWHYATKVVGANEILRVARTSIHKLSTESTENDTMIHKVNQVFPNKTRRIDQERRNIA